MNNNDVIKAAYCCADSVACLDCPLNECDECRVTFANYIKANDLEKKESSKISNSLDFSEINGLFVFEHFKSIVKALGGKVTALSAGNNEARIEYELDDCGYYMSFGGN